jgi:hypothetical protein
MDAEEGGTTEGHRERVAPRAKEQRRKGITNKEQGMVKEAGRECAIFTAQRSTPKERKAHHLSALSRFVIPNEVRHLRDSPLQSNCYHLFTSCCCQAEPGEALSHEQTVCFL